MALKVKTLMIFLFIRVMAIYNVEAVNPIGIIHVNGTLYCTPNGGPSADAPVFPGATVEVSCTADVVAGVPVNATTNSNGVYRVVLIPLRMNTTVDAITSRCRIFVLTPLSTCNSTLPSVGQLVSNLQFVKIVPFTFWSLTYMAATGLTLQS